MPSFFIGFSSPPFRACCSGRRSPWPGSREVPPPLRRDRRAQPPAPATRPVALTPDFPALNILAERYARGELTREEFTGMKKELGGSAPRKG